MTENLPKDGVQSRQAVFVRCCLKKKRINNNCGCRFAPFIVSLCVTDTDYKGRRSMPGEWKAGGQNKPAAKSSL